MKTFVAALAALVIAGPAAAQPIIIELERKPAEQAPQPSPVPVAPPQAEATPGARGQPGPARETAPADPAVVNAPAQGGATSAQPPVR